VEGAERCDIPEAFRARARAERRPIASYTLLWSGKKILSHHLVICVLFAGFSQQGLLGDRCWVSVFAFSGPVALDFWRIDGLAGVRVACVGMGN
jgi:hypothetical protein